MELTGYETHPFKYKYIPVWKYKTEVTKNYFWNEKK